MLFEKSGSTCLSLNIAEPGGMPDFDALARNLPGASGLLSDGRSFVGSLEDAFLAFGLAAVGMEATEAAYGLGRVSAQFALPQLPEGTWWLPELIPFTLSDGRTGWTMSGGYFAAPPRCG